MTVHDWFAEHRTAFVIRSLDPDEERSFREHLEGCLECREEVARVERELAWLPMGARPVTPRPGLERRLIEGVLGIRRPRAAVPWLAAAASLLLALGAGVWAVTQQGARESSAQRIAQLEAQLGDVRDTLNLVRSASRVLQASIQMDRHQGGLLIFADERTHRWNVMVHGLPPAHAGEVYQFWFITETGMVKSVEVHVDQGTPAFMTLPMPKEGGTVMGAALTMEPAGSVSAAPEGKELAHLML